MDARGVGTRRVAVNPSVPAMHFRSGPFGFFVDSYENPLRDREVLRITAALFQRLPQQWNRLAEIIRAGAPCPHPTVGYSCRPADSIRMSCAHPDRQPALHRMDPELDILYLVEAALVGDFFLAP